MIWKLEVKLLFGRYVEEECIRVIEIDSSSTLEDLHFAIQKAVDFDNDHLYEFYSARTERSGDRIIYDDENEQIYDMTLDKLYPLEKKRNLYYLFDFGDNWLFKITKERKKPQKPIDGLKYPIVTKKIGKNPEQYPEYNE